jgi:hypothetical protein
LASRWGIGSILVFFIAGALLLFASTRNDDWENYSFSGILHNSPKVLTFRSFLSDFLCSLPLLSKVTILKSTHFYLDILVHFSIENCWEVLAWDISIGQERNSPQAWLEADRSRGFRSDTIQNGGPRYEYESKH